jgi:hypothetical protein
VVVSEAGTAVTASLRPASAGELAIGAVGSGPKWLSGLIDEVRNNNRALTQGEIQAGMSQTLGGG